jgi:hypothetical protein
MGGSGSKAKVAVQQTEPRWAAEQQPAGAAASSAEELDELAPRLRESEARNIAALDRLGERLAELEKRAAQLPSKHSALTSVQAARDAVAAREAAEREAREAAAREAAEREEEAARDAERAAILYASSPKEDRVADATPPVASRTPSKRSSMHGPVRARSAPRARQRPEKATRKDADEIAAKLADAQQAADAADAQLHAAQDSLEGAKKKKVRKAAAAALESAEAKAAEARAGLQRLQAEAEEAAAERQSVDEPDPEAVEAARRQEELLQKAKEREAAHLERLRIAREKAEVPALAKPLAMSPPAKVDPRLAEKQRAREAGYVKRQKNALRAAAVKKKMAGQLPSVDKVAKAAAAIEEGKKEREEARLERDKLAEERKAYRAANPNWRKEELERREKELEEARIAKEQREEQQQEDTKMAKKLATVFKLDAGELMETFDKNHDGVLDQEEQDAMANCFGYEYKETIRSQFKAMDKDNDGVVDARELTKMLAVDTESDDGQTSDVETDDLDSDDDVPMDMIDEKDDEKDGVVLAEADADIMSRGRQTSVPPKGSPTSILKNRSAARNPAAAAAAQARKAAAAAAQAAQQQQQQPRGRSRKFGKKSAT